MEKQESKDFLTEQIITYLGNKRELLKSISKYVDEVCKRLGKKKLICLDMFSGSGIVARLLKGYSSLIIANDLELYSRVINECYLSNKSELDGKYFDQSLNHILQLINEHPITNGLIRSNYSPADDRFITEADRAFYTNKNAIFIDSYVYYVKENIPRELQKFFLAPLLSEASIHVNTCGVFKGFYKDRETKIGKFGGAGENALSRICGDISISKPALSNFETAYSVYQEDSNTLAPKLPNLDLVYLDPPYNQHPYGSNYFMLNVILENQINTPISKVSGIPNDWNRSNYNKKGEALNSLKDLVGKLDTKYILISYNNEGFISFDEMVNMLKPFGRIKTEAITYNAFRGSRNLNGRKIHTNEYLFLLKKEV